ncbi:MAG: hypothetical protein AAF329_01185 [Cyanobacteria bacterium P01_A01_bin.17]
MLRRIARRWSPRRVTPLTWLLWAALVSDLAAPGYLVFHLGLTTVDITGVRGVLSHTVNDLLGDVLSNTSDEPVITRLTGR